MTIARCVSLNDNGMPMRVPRRRQPNHTPMPFRDSTGGSVSKSTGAGGQTQKAAPNRARRAQQVSSANRPLFASRRFWQVSLNQSHPRPTDKRATTSRGQAETLEVCAAFVTAMLD